ncbi:MAG: PKD domain-containing protein [Chitinophagales bacterium]
MMSLHPLGIDASISINPNTGILYAVPSTQGLFTVGICVEEYRNGIFLNRVVQDIQLNVSDCVIPSAIPAVATGVGIPVYQSDDTTYKSCNGLKVNFANESVGNIKNYKWDFGDLTTLVDTSNLATPSYIYADTGRYEVTLIINPGEFCGDTSKMIVYVYKELAGNFTMNDACPKTAVQFTDYSNSFYNDLVSWKWKFGNGDSTFTQNPNYSYNNSGTYKVQLRAETALGCVVTAEKNITIYPTPKANFTNDFICYKSATQFNNTSTISSGTIDSYLWSFGDGTQSTATNPSHTFSAFQDATVELKTVSNFGCRDSIQKTIIIDDTLVLNTTSIQSNYCENELETIDNTTSGGNNLSYSWLHNGTEIATTQNITLPTNVFNQNRITLVAKNRCEEKTKSFNYFVQKAPNKTLAQNNIILCPGQTDTVFSFQALDSIFWNTNENNLNYIIIDGTIDPIIAKMYLKECSIEDTLQLNLDCDVAIPNAFSPNLDGVNDYFNLINSGSVETFKLQVFNRWGELLFETDSYNKPWDGTYKNQDVPVDSYVYIVKGIKKDTKNFFLKGIFNLFR